MSIAQYVLHAINIIQNINIRKKSHNYNAVNILPNINVQLIFYQISKKELTKYDHQTYTTIKR